MTGVPMSTSCGQGDIFGKSRPGLVENVDATPKVQFMDRAKFWWKTGILAFTTLAVIPILLYQHILGATFYIGFLLVVHIGGLFIFAYGVKKDQIAPSMRGFWGRMAGLVSLGVLLYLASKGLQAGFGSTIFWISLFGIWATHTAGLLLLHLRGRNETNCPFL